MALTRGWDTSPSGPMFPTSGYNTIGYFAPHAAYSAAVRAGSSGGQVGEFQAMVRAMHEAGLEVILDVVFNHTAEGGEGGPSLCFRGLDNTAYYRLDPGPGEPGAVRLSRVRWNSGQPPVFAACRNSVSLRLAMTEPASAVALRPRTLQRLDGSSGCTPGCLATSKTMDSGAPGKYRSAGR